MGLSRRQFTKEFKLAALRRLYRGSSVAKVARALVVAPNNIMRGWPQRLPPARERASRPGEAP
ncbi:MAG: transposase [Acidobacteriia bacterium]|nr:transposase [Terriglobia bacterium]